MTARKTILFLIALVLLIVVIALQFAGPRGASEGPTVAALVPKYDIPPFTLIEDDSLQTISVPAATVGTVIYTDTTDLVGLLTTAQLRAGNVVKPEDVIKLPEGFVLDADTLIYSVYVPTARVVGGQLRAGHRVDLLATRPDTRDEAGLSRWLARGLWVVSVKQTDGGVVRVPTAERYSVAEPTEKDAAGLFGGSTGLGDREGPANMVLVATHREIAKMIGEYYGAQGYDAWVYIRPAGTADSMGRIDGEVFEDIEPFGIQTRNELGLDRVSVTLFDENDVAKATAQTSSGGKFHFDSLAPANYRVTVTVPDGYTPATPKDVSFYLAEGQNQHVLFGEQKAEPEATPAPVVVVVTATPAPATQSTTRAPGQAIDGAYALHMSNLEGGPSIITFPAPVKEVWAVVAFRDVPNDTPYTVRIQTTAASNQERVVSVGTWKGGSGTVSIRIGPWEGDEFAEGAYVTSLETGAEGTTRAFKAWSVSSETDRHEGDGSRVINTGPADPETESLPDYER
jgi:Flp pilus assembly protein CpaB